MHVTVKKETEKSQQLLTIELIPPEYEPYLQKGAAKIARDVKLPGFRPGNIPYDVIKQKFGEAEIIKEALPDIITATYYQALKEKKIETIGQPEINVIKMAPGNNLIYSAKVAYLPIINLPDITNLQITAKKITVTDQEIDTAIKNLHRSRAKDQLVSRAARNQDLIKLDCNISLLGVPQENGQQKNIEVYLGENHMIPGFEKELIGLKADDTKKFSLKFPDDYFQKNFAGKTCDFEVKINGIYELIYPPINDDFAQTLGHFASLAELKNKLRENLTAEKKYHEDLKVEKDLFNKLITLTTFPPLPEVLINHELEQILHEFEHDLINRGLQLETWLKNIQKSLDEFKQDLQPEALKRAHITLLLRTVAINNKIEVTDQELNDELTKTKQSLSSNTETAKQINSSAYRTYLKNILTTKKAVNWLKEKIIK
jgi:trigger factor